MTKTRYLWMGLVSLGVFVTLGIAVRSQPTSIDLAVAKFSASHRTHGEIAVANIVSKAASPIVVSLLAIALISLWNYRTRRRLAQDFIPIALIVASGIATTSAKSIFHRVRPGLKFSTIYDAEPGFPSSHTVFIAVAGSAFLLVFAKKRLLMIMAIFVATSLMGLDRLILGVHWFTDLVGSALLSLGLFFLFAALKETLLAGYE